VQREQAEGRQEFGQSPTFLDTIERHTESDSRQDLERISGSTIAGCRAQSELRQEFGQSPTFIEKSQHADVGLSNGDCGAVPSNREESVMAEPSIIESMIYHSNGEGCTVTLVGESRSRPSIGEIGDVPSNREDEAESSSWEVLTDPSNGECVFGSSNEGGAKLSNEGLDFQLCFVVQWEVGPPNGEGDDVPSNRECGVTMWPSIRECGVGHSNGECSADPSNGECRVERAVKVAMYSRTENVGCVHRTPSGNATNSLCTCTLSSDGLAADEQREEALSVEFDWISSETAARRSQGAERN
jgi:hypothetical protein